jgi:phosphoglycerate kinase
MLPDTGFRCGKKIINCSSIRVDPYIFSLRLCVRPLLEGGTMNKLGVEDLQIKGRRVLMRVDFNVPLEDGRVANDKRIRAALPTIRYVIDSGGRLVLMSHLGRPKGERVAEMSLRPCHDCLAQLLDRDVRFVDDCIGDSVTNAVQALAEGDILLLENLRFYRQETDNDPEFSSHLAQLGDVYVNDAFGTAHRAHASTVGVTAFFDRRAAGYLMMKELDYLGRLMEDPERPFVAILGGAKISGKIDVISNLLPKVDTILIGGGMAFTFFKAMGREIGRSLLEEEKVDLARDLLQKAAGKLVLPVDCMVADQFDFGARKTGSLQPVRADAIPSDAYGLDIGPESIAQVQEILTDARTIVWNGPMGVFEIPDTATGTFAVAGMLADATDRGAVTVIGGGDSAAAVNQAGVADRVSHVSTGGGASLEFMEGKVLPGVAALSNK